MTSQSENLMKLEKPRVSSMKTEGKRVKSKQRVRFDLANLESNKDNNTNKEHQQRVASSLSSQSRSCQGRKRRHSESSAHDYDIKIVMKGNERSTSGNLKVVSNETGTYRVVKGPDFILTQRIKAYRDDKRKGSVAMPQFSTKTTRCSRCRPELVKDVQTQNDLLDSDNGLSRCLMKRLRSSSRSSVIAIMHSRPVPADLLRARLEMLQL